MTGPASPAHPPRPSVPDEDQGLLRHSDRCDAPSCFYAGQQVPLPSARPGSGTVHDSAPL